MDSQWKPLPLQSQNRIRTVFSAVVNVDFSRAAAEGISTFNLKNRCPKMEMKSST
jgi:hypothetical protein